ncbi:MAG: hypothetical protein IJY09_00195 [Lachnospiraceae bacterium]|nr:hypothetical protein [Lachnospiraceae bacterium]
MRASESTYAKVAENCSAFAPKENMGMGNATNSMSKNNSNVSCRTCKHFSKDEHCVLDLYDQIVMNHNLK